MGGKRAGPPDAGQADELGRTVRESELTVDRAAIARAIALATGVTEPENTEPVPVLTIPASSPQRSTPSDHDASPASGRSVAAPDDADSASGRGSLARGDRVLADPDDEERAALIAEGVRPSSRSRSRGAKKPNAHVAQEAKPVNKPKQAGDHTILDETPEKAQMTVATPEARAALEDEFADQTKMDVPMTAATKVESSEFEDLTRADLQAGIRRPKARKAAEPASDFDDETQATLDQDGLSPARPKATRKSEDKRVAALPRAASAPELLDDRYIFNLVTADVEQPEPHSSAEPFLFPDTWVGPVPGLEGAGADGSDPYDTLVSETIDAVVPATWLEPIPHAQTLAPDRVDSSLPGMEDPAEGFSSLRVASERTAVLRAVVFAREAERHVFSDTMVPVLISWSGKAHAGKVRDVSSGGLFVETEAQLPFGSDVTVGLTLKDGRDVPFSGKVVWTPAEGIAVRLLGDLRGKALFLAFIDEILALPKGQTFSRTVQIHCDAPPPTERARTVEDTSLGRDWALLLEKGGEDAAHKQFIHTCLKARRLDYALECYRSLKSDPARRDLAMKYLTQVGMILNFQALAKRPKTDRMGRVYKRALYLTLWGVVMFVVVGVIFFWDELKAFILGPP